MTNRLPYHEKREDLVLSLCYITPSRERAEGIVADKELEAEDATRVVTNIERHDFDNEVYAVYAAESHPRQFPDGWERGLSDSEIVLVDSVINTFRGVQQEWDKRGAPLNYYKQPDPARISDAFDDVRWRQDVEIVGGEIMSSLIKKHALPNANHRTAVAYLRTYLQSVAETTDPDFIPAGNYQGDWHDWARKHVHESKRLLLLRRKPDLLQYAKSVGVDKLYRKSGIEIDLSAHDFEGQDVHSMANEGHRNRCIQFAADLIERSEHQEVKDRIDDGRRAFVDRLQ
ncbi:hypothetical protein [Haloarcula sp. CBA1127]|uniref:hypothetical protein n=1 Tax=Haloarcula sp. CBA1127 TaxID=1765055 RepID=UPI000ACCE052|nr:hypothetical protein [Haloarcula sp. CBA1127]